MLPPPGRFEFVWDMGERWKDLTGLPFVFAMWIARPNVDLQGLDEALAAARDEGVGRLAEIAHVDAPAVGLPEAKCLAYLRDHIHYHLAGRRRQGLERFYALAGQHGLAPRGVELVFYDATSAE
jgi:chorismate dehydratase